MTDDVDGTLELIRDQALRLFKHSATPEHLKQLLEAPGQFDTALWGAAVEQVWPAIAIPEAAGGIGLGWRGLCVLMEALGSHTASLPLVGNAVAAAALLDSGDPRLIDEPVAVLSSGTAIACLGLGSPQHDDTDAPAALRWQAGELHGSTGLLAFAAVADYALVCAKSGTDDILLWVGLNQPGVQRDVAPTFDNARAYAGLQFDGAHAHPLSHSQQPARHWLHLAALATAFEQIGGASACMLMARDYALERVAFGQPIGRFQAIKHKVADVYARVEIARGCALDALHAVEQDDPQAAALAIGARLAAIDAYEAAARENIQIHGGLGVTWEAWPHHYYRRSRSLALELGSQQTWRDALLTQLGFDLADHP
ncbi:acyl-CoA dehydrogenase family protein [Pseudomonas baltica]|uniref:acyl-CoA dehydrogenase family protein n=1 Tax=Pseudomonas baltica TaxID=2762576 RepID=UPI00289F6D27|nr:acyl-CoA dehydrogenase family protein [Pseudomonas baltica]